MVKNYVEDPLNYTGKISTRSVNELFTAMTQVQEGASRITLPVILLHGGTCLLVMWGASDLFF